MAEKSSELVKTTTDETSEALATAASKEEYEETALTKTETASGETTEAPEDEITDETEQLREQIVETRREMGETIDAIQEKLSLANISEQVQTQVSEQISGAVEAARGVLYDKAGDLAETVNRGLKQFGETDLAKRAQRNPTATALIGAGVGALLVSLLIGGKKKQKQKPYDYSYDYDDVRNKTKLSYADDKRGTRLNFDDDGGDDDDIRYADSSRRELSSGATTTVARSAAVKKPSASDESASQSARKRVGDTASSAYETVSDAAGSAYESVSSAASKTYESVGNAAGKTYQGLSSAAGYTYEKAGDLGGQVKINYEHYIEENPLAVGAVALALGAAVGLAIPLTAKENEYLGEYRDQVVGKAQEAAQDAIGSVKQLATDAQKVIAEEVKSKTA